MCTCEQAGRVGGVRADGGGGRTARRRPVRALLLAAVGVSVTGAFGSCSTSAFLVIFSLHSVDRSQDFSGRILLTAEFPNREWLTKKIQKFKTIDIISRLKLLLQNWILKCDFVDVHSPLGPVPFGRRLQVQALLLGRLAVLGLKMHQV